MTSISLVAGADLFWPPWSSHWSMEPGPWDDVHPFSPKAKGPGPPEVTADANSMLSISGSPAPPSGPVKFSTSACMPSPEARTTKSKTWSSKYRTQMFGVICIWIWLYRFYINHQSHMGKMMTECQQSRTEQHETKVEMMDRLSTLLLTSGGQTVHVQVTDFKYLQLRPPWLDYTWNSSVLNSSYWASDLWVIGQHVLTRRLNSTTHTLTISTASHSR